MKKVLLILTVMVCGLMAQAQTNDFLPPQPKSARAADSHVKMLYNVDFLTFFDNREYDRSPYQRSQTLFGVRLSPEIGVLIADSTVGQHRIMAGCSYIQPIGADYKDAKVLPTIYYQFNKRGFGVHLGMLPFTKMIENLPDYLMYDSITYFHPNIQGALFNYQDKRGFVEIMADWRGMWSADTREAFRVVLNGRYQYKWFFVGGRAMMNHLACYAPDSPKPPVGVCDDLLGSAYFGFDLGKRTNVTPLDSFVIRANYIISFENDRNAGVRYLPQGGLLEIFLRWKWIGFRNVTYYGQCQMPLFPSYRYLLNQGDGFYQSTFYNRSDIFFYIYNNSFVNCFASFNFHVDDKAFTTSQQVIAQFSLDGVWNYKNNKKKLRSVLGK
ncbi:MAG: hypothetical protein MJ003_06875 [Paludibacteraceae bacterium]|nr:hypothetical protein [Paludibacteraceae bacterium]